MFCSNAWSKKTNLNKFKYLAREYKTLSSQEEQQNQLFQPVSQNNIYLNSSDKEI